MNSAPRRAAIYARISQVSDESDLTSVQDQEALCREWATAHGWQVSQVYVDSGKSAWARNVTRTGYKSLMAAIRAGDHDGLIVRHIDRLTRQLRELIPFIDAVDDARVRVATLEGDFDLSTPGSRSLVKILAVMAEQESERKGERQRIANKKRASTGATYGRHHAFGWKDKALTEPDPEQAQLIRDALQDIVQGKSTVRLAQEWNDKGIRTNRGNIWTQQNLNRVIRSPKVIGVLEKGRQPLANVESKITPLVDENLYRTALAILATRRNGYVVKGKHGDYERSERTSNKYVLSGLLKCHCGSGMHGATTPDRRLYVCSNTVTGRCWTAMTVRLAENKIIDYAVGELSRMNPKEVLGEDVWRQQQQIANDLQELDSQYAEIAKRKLSVTSKALLLEELDQNKANLSDHLSRLAPAGTRARLISDLLRPDKPSRTTIRDWGKHRQIVRERFMSLTIEQQRALIGELGTYVIHPAATPVSAYGRIAITHPTKGPIGTEQLDQD